MRSARHLVASAAFVLLSATACSGTATPASSPEPASPEGGSSASSPSASPTSLSDRAKADVQDLVLEYYEVADLVSQDPSDTGALKAVASGTELASFRAELKDWASNNWHQTGETTVVKTIVQTLNVEAGGATASTAEVDVCYDVSGTDLVDADGESQVAAGRADRGWERLRITNARYEDEPSEGWRVDDRETLEQEPCTGR